MRLFRLVYVSTAVDLFTPASLRALVEDAEERNASLDITGVLLFSGGAFLQVLEGAEGRVSELFARIQLDPRHMWVECVQRDRVDERLFPDWSMGLQNFDEHAAIDPHHMRVIRDFLNHCAAVCPDQTTEGLLSYFRQIAARIAA